jgi:hypothetical protein
MLKARSSMLYLCAFLFISLGGADVRADYSCHGDCTIRFKDSTSCDGTYGDHCDAFCRQCSAEGGSCRDVGGTVYSVCEFNRVVTQEVRSTGPNRPAAERDLERACGSRCNGYGYWQECHHSLTDTSCY